MNTLFKKAESNGKPIVGKSWALKLTLLAVMATFLTLNLFPATSDAKTLTLGHTVPPSHVWHQVAVKFAENLKAASQGKLKIRVVPLQKLGNEPQMFSMTQSGAIAFTILPAAFVANREASLQGWFLPYLFQDVQEAGDAVSLPASQEMLEKLRAHNVVGLGYMFAGMRHVLSVKPVKSPDDLVNQKIRAFPSPIFNDWWKANGAAPTALPLAEIAPALTTNLLDAVDVDLDIIVGLKYYQQANYLALTNHMAFPAVLLASKKWWDSLSPEDREMIKKAYHEAELYGIDLQRKAETTNLETLKKAGVKVSDVDLTQFKEKGRQVRDKYINENELIKAFAGQVEKKVK